MSRIWSVALLGLAMLTAVSTGDERTDSSKDTKFDDITFVQMAASCNLAEIKAGKMAKEKAEQGDVRAYAEMMVTDHMKAQEETKKLATAMDLSLPMQPLKEHDACLKFSDKSGREFDRAYIDCMIEGHEKAIKRFTRATKEARNDKVRSFATEMLPKLKEHLEKAKEVQKKLGART